MAQQTPVWETPTPLFSEPQNPANSTNGNTHQPNQAYNANYAPIIKPPAPPFVKDRTDQFFFLGALLFGFFFARWMVMPLYWEGWGVTFCTVLYAGLVGSYTYLKKVKPSIASYFWLGIFLLSGTSFALWPPNYLYFWQVLLLLGSGIYWTGCIFGVLILGKTSNFLFLDILNLLFSIPFKNMDILPAIVKKKTASNADSPETETTKQYSRHILIGLIIGLPIIAILAPMLMAADNGGFAALLTSVGLLLSKLFTDSMANNLFALFLGLPLAIYIVMLVIGSAHKRHIHNFNPENTRQSFNKARRLHSATVITILLLVTSLFFIFIVSQIPYLFLAFSGKYPEGYVLYSDYARDGFFELCTVATLTMCILLLTGCFSQLEAKSTKIIKLLNILLALLTLLLIATAFRKMALYIQMHGYTQKRLMTCVFMVFLAGVFVAHILRQFRDFSILRFAAVFGCSLLCIFSLINMDGIVCQLNAQYYNNGTLPVYEPIILARSNSAGIQGGLLALEGGKLDKEQYFQVITDLEQKQNTAELAKGTPQDCLAYAWARQYKLPATEDTHGVVE